MLSVKQKCSLRTRLKYVEWPLPGVQTVGATLREMRVGKRARGWGRDECVFSRPTTKKANYWESNKGQPAETINMKVSGEVNLIILKLNLFPIRFLVDKVKKN